MGKYPAVETSRPVNTGTDVTTVGIRNSIEFSVALQSGIDTKLRFVLYSASHTCYKVTSSGLSVAYSYRLSMPIFIRKKEIVVSHYFKH
jgi:hypothetical protein